MSHQHRFPSDGEGPRWFGVYPAIVSAELLQRGRLRQQETLATSVGIGVRVKTVVGPIKFDLGVDTTKLEFLDSINGTREHVLIHFTIGDF